MNFDLESGTSSEKDCAVCLQKCHHPTQLPCGHVFCFLCVKGVAIQSKKCAMCRAVIPSDYLDNPVILEKLTLNSEENNVQLHQWYYEGWWKYDERSNDELEAAWNTGATECSLLLAGAVYCIDFSSMMQTRRNDRTRRRHVRRDAPSLPAKGIAGIKINDENNKTETDESSPSSPRDVPFEPNPETYESALSISQEAESSLDEEQHIDNVVDNLNSLNINDPEDT